MKVYAYYPGVIRDGHGKFHAACHSPSKDMFSTIWIHPTKFETIGEAFAFAEVQVPIVDWENNQEWFTDLEQL